jgi:hypothetical protein
MARKTYSVIDPNGERHTRKTERTYTHAVLRRPGLEAVDRMRAGVAAAADRAGNDYDRTVRESRGVFAKVDVGSRPQHVLDKWQAFAVEFLAADADYSKGRDHVVDKARADASKAAEDYAASKTWDLYECLGWCGRHDLALKMQAKYPGSIIVEAPEETKGA